MRIIVTSGGTGGHIYPAISLIKYLENNGENVTFIGSKDRMEEGISKKENIDFIGYAFGDRKTFINKVKFYINIIKVFFKSFNYLKKEKANIIVGFGNYISFPVCIAGKLMGIPVIIHEQNCVIGKANKILGFFADKIAYSLPLIHEVYKDKLVNIGNPRSSECMKETSNKIIDLNKKNVLIFMGSLGSKTIINILKKFIFICDDTIIYHIVTGKGLYNELKELNDKNNIKIYEYIDDMISFMKKCDLVVTRSGATTISEIITIGIPSILIPSPYVVNNHQYLNAKYLLDNNACLLIEEKNLNENVLNSKINYLLNNSNLRINMRINALKLAVFDSNSRFYKLINEVIKIEQ